jgi:hypothetical protein
MAFLLTTMHKLKSAEGGRDAETMVVGIGDNGGYGYGFERSSG